MQNLQTKVRQTKLRVLRFAPTSLISLECGKRRVKNMMLEETALSKHGKEFCGIE